MPKAVRAKPGWLIREDRRTKDDRSLSPEGATACRAASGVNAETSGKSLPAEPIHETGLVLPDASILSSLVFPGGFSGPWLRRDPEVDLLLEGVDP